MAGMTGVAVAQTVVATITVGSGPIGVGVNPTTNKIYVSNYGSGSVSVIDGATDTVTATVTVGTNPFGVGVNPATNKIYVANYGSGTVSVIDGATEGDGNRHGGHKPICRRSQPRHQQDLRGESRQQ